MSRPVARSGDALGREGLKTRTAMLAELQDALDSKTPWRHISILDIARAVGKSPATFYQHWPDIETATAELARDTKSAGKPFSEHFRLIVVLLRYEGYRVPDLTDYVPMKYIAKEAS